MDNMSTVLNFTCRAIVLWVNDRILLKQKPKWDDKNTQPPLFMNIEHFKRLFAVSGIQRPAEAVLKRLLNNYIHRFHAVSSPESAFELYDFFNNLPATTTKDKLEYDYGIRLNDLYDPTFNANIITGADKTSAPILAKILMSSEVRMTKDLDLENSLVPGIVQTKICSVSLEGKDYTNRFSDGKYYCLIMPHYPRSLALLANLLTSETLLEEGKKILKALEYIHVKPANIFVSTNGEWFLGDFGSCVKIGETVVSCSEAYLPFNGVGREKARVGFDFFMLAVSLVVLLIDLKQIMHDNILSINISKLNKAIDSISCEPLKFFILKADLGQDCESKFSIQL